VYPYDPTRNDPRWLDFNKRFEDRFHEKPEQFASMAFDTMNMLLDSICKAGLNRARIHDALADIEEYDGVTGHMSSIPIRRTLRRCFSVRPQRHDHLPHGENGQRTGSRANCCCAAGAV